MGNKPTQIAVTFAIVFNILSCSKAPSVRPLPGPTPLAIDSIRLGPTLSVQDFRKIHSALNREGKLNSLTQWFSAVPDEDLRTIARIVSEELYESALDRQGLIQILRERNERSGFSLWRSINPLKKEKYQPFVWTYLSFPTFSDFFPQQSSFISLEVQNIVASLPELASRYPYAQVRPDTEFDPKLFAQETKTLLQNEEFKKQVLSLAGSLSENNLFERLLRVFKTAKETNAKAFIAFSTAFASFSDTKLQDFLDTLSVIDEKPNGLFSVADKYIKASPEYRRNIALEVQPFLNQGLITHTIDFLKSNPEAIISADLIQNLIRKDAELPPSQAFQTVREKIVLALQRNFQVNITYDPILEYYSYLITKTLEENVRVNFEKLSTTKEENFWRLPLKSEKVKLVLFSNAGVFNEQVHKDLVALGMQDVEKFVVAAYEKKNVFLKNLYVSKAETESTSLEEVLALSMESVFSLKPLAEPAVLLNAFLVRADLSSLEKHDNLLSLIESYSAMFSAEEINSLDTWLFHKFDLPTFLNERLPIIFEMYGDREDLKIKFSKIVNCLTYLHEFHHASHSNVSGLALPWSYLNEIGTNTKRQSVINQFFSVFRTSQIFKNENANHEYRKFFRNPNLLAKYLFALGSLTEEETLLVSTKFRRLDLAKNWQMITSLSQSNGEAFDSILMEVFKQGTELLPDTATLSEKEREWIQRFSQSKNFKLAVELFNKYGSRSNYSAMMKDLYNLSQNGDLAQALEFLNRLQNDRMHAISSTLLEMDKSKQMLELLNFLQAQ